MTRSSTPVRSLTAIGTALTLTLGLAACSSQDTLTVCTSIPYEPFQFKDSWQDNKVVGFDVDIMDLVAKELDLKQEIVDIGFEQIDSGQALEEGTCDVAAAALTITPPREEVMSFSDPYYDAKQALGAKPGSKIKTLKDMKGKVLGVQRDSTGFAYADENQDKYEYDLKTYNDLGKLREAVLYDQVDAAINDVPLWTSKVTDDQRKLEIIEKYDTGEEYGYAVAKDNDELLSTINEVLAKSRKNGDFEEIYQKWIGED
ncbi:ABC transporter substrate-binding protein [Stackebrandtia nassauensis]|uniref:Extracellular solute-binding protein family 3 n=1 Tax=Stackebrandtia nassauensis (strain DSM 44728 / CIP 108903 / NRRL B-16338 / NBRC 102104 / LLR-40K-21) TaxID=446470 RepID=D3Q8W3_STANL|nr:ABC transporter substrate-binding protein [Stackebrandtia nassauensis]ADD40572.1 extracellular solute-binding protein family 3 [Stackebrandtia nassauensis DSM 44728]